MTFGFVRGADGFPCGAGELGFGTRGGGLGTPLRELGLVRGRMGTQKWLQRTERHLGGLKRMLERRNWQVCLIKARAIFIEGIEGSYAVPGVYIAAKAGPRQ